MSPRDMAAEALVWLAGQRLRLRRRRRFRAQTAADIARLGARLDYIYGMMEAAVQEVSATGLSDVPPGYLAAAQVQARRRQIHLAGGTAAQR